MQAEKFSKKLTIYSVTEAAPKCLFKPQTTEKLYLLSTGVATWLQVNSNSFHSSHVEGKIKQISKPECQPMLHRTANKGSTLPNQT